MSASQQKIMQYLPVVFAVFLVFYLTGLVIYYMAQAIFRIGLQYYITRRFYKGEHSLGQQAQRAGAQAREISKADGGGGGLFAQAKRDLAGAKDAPAGKGKAANGAKGDDQRSTPTRPPSASGSPRRRTRRRRRRRAGVPHHPVSRHRARRVGPRPPLRAIRRRSEGRLTMEWVETTGKTIEEAKGKALDQLGVAEDDAEFDVLDEPRAGLFGRIRGEARVRATGASHPAATQARPS